MTPGIYNITAYRGDTLQRTITLVDGSNNPISLATAAVKIEVRTKPDGDIKLTLTEGDGITVSGAGNNVITISKVVSISDSCALYYDLQATFASGVVSTYLKGNFNVVKDITT
jgi:hypothetical protein